MNNKGGAIAELAVRVVKDDTHGYSQLNRFGTGDVVYYRLEALKGDEVCVHAGDYDCSSFVQAVLEALDVIPKQELFYTGNEVQILVDNEFYFVNRNRPEKGDVLYRTGHTAFYVGNNKIAEFSRSENLSIDGETGDQDGQEGRVATYYPDMWECVLRAPDIDEGVGDCVNCIIKVNNSTGHYYFDGQKLHILTKPEELEILDEIHKNVFGCVMPRLFWSVERLDILKSFLK